MTNRYRLAYLLWGIWKHDKSHIFHVILGLNYVHLFPVRRYLYTAADEVAALSASVLPLYLLSQRMAASSFGFKVKLHTTTKHHGFYTKHDGFQGMLDGCGKQLAFARYRSVSCRNERFFNINDDFLIEKCYDVCVAACSLGTSSALLSPRWECCIGCVDASFYCFYAVLYCFAMLFSCYK